MLSLATHLWSQALEWSARRRLLRRPPLPFHNRTTITGPWYPMCISSVCFGSPLQTAVRACVLLFCGYARWLNGFLINRSPVPITLQKPTSQGLNGDLAPKEGHTPRGYGGHRLSALLSSSSSLSFSFPTTGIVSSHLRLGAYLT